MSLVEYVLTVVGMTYLVTQASIVGVVRAPIARKLGAFGAGLYCAACTGFWTGLALHGAHLSPYTQGPWWLDLLLAGVTAMGIGHLWQQGTGGNPMYEIEQLAPRRAAEEGAHAQEEEI